MMNGKDCRVTRREIDESELNQRLSDQARLHVASCASCRGFRAERTSLRELVGSLEPVAAPGDFEMRLRARLASEKESRAQRPFFFRFVIGTPAIAAAALVLLLVLSVAWFAQRNKTQSSDVAKVPIQSLPIVPQPLTLPVNTSSDSDTVAQAGTSGKDDKNSARLGNIYRDKGSRTTTVTAHDYGTSPAESYRQVEQRPGEVSLSAPLKPMVVSMQDGRGETRRISLPPVSFGAQRIGDNRIAVGATNSRSW